MKGLPTNIVLVSGNLTSDPDFAAVGASSISKLSFTIANNIRYGQGSDAKEITSFLRAVAWKNLADRLKDRFAKGDAVLVEGRIQSNSWQDKTSGERRHSVEIVASKVYRLDTQASKPEGNTDPQYHKTQEAPPPAATPPVPDDDIPF